MFAYFAFEPNEEFDIMKIKLIDIPTKWGSDSISVNNNKESYNGNINRNNTF